MSSTEMIGMYRISSRRIRRIRSMKILMMTSKNQMRSKNRILIQRTRASLALSAVDAVDETDAVRAPKRSLKPRQQRPKKRQIARAVEVETSALGHLQRTAVPARTSDA